jgi:hypothetical protein
LAIENVTNKETKRREAKLKREQQRMYTETKVTAIEREQAGREKEL